MSAENMISNIILESREKLSIGGVKEILTFDEDEIMLDTVLGILEIRGKNLKVEKLSTDTGEIIAKGYIDEIVYPQEHSTTEKRGNILKNIFR